MNEENSKRVTLIPIMSIAIFMILIFSAGYAYFTMNTTKAANTANANFTMPGRPTLTCNKTDSAVTIQLANMIQSKNGNIAGTATPKLECTCKGSGFCTFDVNLQAPSGFTLKQNNEVTFAFTANKSGMPSSCANITTAANFSAGKKATGCKIQATTSGNTFLFTGTINFYNINAEQGDRGGSTYVFTLKSENPAFTTS